MKINVTEADGEYHNKSQKAADLIVELIKLNSQIEPHCWLSAMIGLMMNALKNSGSSFEEASHAVNASLEIYRKGWGD